MAGHGNARAPNALYFWSEILFTQVLSRKLCEPSEERLVFIMIMCDYKAITRHDMSDCLAIGVDNQNYLPSHPHICAIHMPHDTHWSGYCVNMVG